MSKNCIFCGSADLSEEHIFSRWLHKHLPPVANQTLHVTGAEAAIGGKPIKFSRATLKKGKGVTSTTVRCVCRACNHGWMEKIERGVRPYLPTLISGSADVISGSSQKALIDWVTLKFMIMDVFARPDIKSSFAYEDVRNFYEHQISPEALRIWAAANASDYIWRIAHDAAGQPYNDRPDDADIRYVQHFIFALGSIVFVGFYSARSDRWFPPPVAYAPAGLYALLDRTGDIRLRSDFAVVDADLSALNDTYLSVQNGLIRRTWKGGEIPPETKSVRLLVGHPAATDHVVMPAMLPLFKGTEYSNILCGSCPTIIGEGVTLQSIRELTPATRQRTLIRCPQCQAASFLPLRVAKKGQVGVDLDATQKTFTFVLK